MLATSLGVLLTKFSAVAFIPGNHDLWVKREDRTPPPGAGAGEGCGVRGKAAESRGPSCSFGKLEAVLAVCGPSTTTLVLLP